MMEKFPKNFNFLNLCDTCMSEEILPIYIKFSWLLLFIPAVFLLLGGITIIFQFDSSDFESNTGKNWDTFSTEEDEIANYIVRLTRLLGVSSMSIALFSALIAYYYLRGGEKWAWLILWILPLTLLGISIVFFLNNATGIGGYYAFLVLLTIIGQLLPFRNYT